MISNDNISDFLIENADKKYLKFPSSLVPYANNMIGARLPALRKLANVIAKENKISNYLQTAKNNYFEEIMLQGLVIGYSKLEIYEIIFLCKSFIPKINNWSICDSFCNSLKISKKYPDEMWKFILEYINSNKEYELRFLLVMCINYFVNYDKLNDIFNIIERIQNRDINYYYTNMAIAWLLCECYIKFSDQTLKYLQKTSINKFTYNKVIQKILESYKVTDSDKMLIRNLKK